MKYHWEVDPGAVHLWLILSKATRAVEKNARASIAGLGLGISDFAVLELLLHKGPQHPTEIGRRVLLTSGSVTAAIDRLESRGWVRRSPSATDLRSRTVELTGAGKTFIAEAFGKHSADLEQTMSVLSSRERKELTRLLKKLGMWAEACAEG